MAGVGQLGLSAQALSTLLGVGKDHVLFAAAELLDQGEIFCTTNEEVFAAT